MKELVKGRRISVIFKEREPVRVELYDTVDADDNLKWRKLRIDSDGLGNSSLPELHTRKDHILAETFADALDDLLLKDNGEIIYANTETGQVIVLSDRCTIASWESFGFTVNILNRRAVRKGQIKGMTKTEREELATIGTKDWLVRRCGRTFK